MILGIMQPYFFPYLGHFALIAATDNWIVFDTSQFKPKSWMTRNRILHPRDGWRYVQLAVSNGSQNRSIRETFAKNPEDSKHRLLRQLEVFRSRAPFFHETQQVITKAFARRRGDSVGQVDLAALESVCDYLQIPLRARLLSELNLNLPKHLGAGEWALEICARLGAHKYLNPISGQSLFSPMQFCERNVKLAFLSFETWIYECGPYNYTPDLSILDVLLWNEPAKVKSALHAQVRIVVP